MRPRALLILPLALLAIACGRGGDLADACTPVTTTSTDQTTRPEIVVPDGQAPPDTLQVCDVVTGDGAAAATGDEVLVQYVGVSWSTGEEFDASWDRPGEPFSFQLGAGLVIPGWDLGLVGATEGSRRELIIPPHQAYQAEGRPPLIGPNETLVFVIDVLEVTPSTG